MTRVFFATIGERTRPVGGMKVIYQGITALRRAGIDAYAVAAKGALDWLAGSPALANISEGTPASL